MTDPRTLSELVPAQTLAKALLEAEEFIERIANMKTSKDDRQNTLALNYIVSQALAQIQRIKKGEIV